jgi:hypothetical protein
MGLLVLLEGKLLLPQLQFFLEPPVFSQKACGLGEELRFLLLPLRCNGKVLTYLCQN